MARPTVFLTALVLMAAAMTAAAFQGQAVPPATGARPPVIPSVTVPTNPPATSSVTPARNAGPAARTAESLIIGQVVDTGGRPVPRAVVRLIGSQLVDTVVADDKGRFAFRRVPLGEIVVAAEKAGFFSGGYGQRRASGLPLPFSLPFGQVLSNMRIELYRAGVITGSLADQAGEAAVGVRVVALRRQFVAGEWRYATIASDDTDDNGAYRLFGLAPGEYLVAVPSADITLPASGTRSEVAPLADGAPSSVFTTLFFAGADEQILAQPIALHPDETRYGVNFTVPLVPAPRVIGRLARSGTPAANQRVRIMPLDAGWTAPEAIAEAESSVDGTFVFERIPAGRYQFLAGNVAAVLRAASQPGDGAADGARAFCARREIVVDANERAIELGDVELVPTATLNGHVSLEPYASGAPPPPTPARISITIDPALPGLSPSATLDVDVSRPFLVSNLIPGDYFIHVEGLPAGWFLKGLEAGNRSALDEPAAVTTGSINLAIALSTRGSEVIGTVRDARMQFAAGAAIVIVPIQSDGRAFWAPNRVRETRASTSGVFDVIGLPPGDYAVVAIDDAKAEGWQDPTRLAALRQQATRFRIRDAETVSLVLTLSAVK